MPVSVELTHLTKTFGKTTAVNDFNLTAYPSQIIALLGPNGAGKSTLMNMITGYLAPSSGNICILGKDLSSDSLAVKQSIGFLPEGSPLYADMTVKSFITYLSRLKSLPADEVFRVISLANLETVTNQKIETLSKGYRRRVGFAAALLGNPPVLLLDEPTDGLDPNQKEHLLGLISDMGKDKTILISTHLLDEAKSVANRILIMDKGTLKADGDLNAILKQTRTTSLENAFIKLTR
ncbi:MAG: ABC transporter ATP-binding protein [bacterium]|mgnify:FL=1|nr:ABC transporter ATP-binding protein [bacterium]MDY2830338.1 ABC transporter ATP-binding protein [Alphaproteobacteria bacterium]